MITFEDVWKQNVIEGQRIWFPSHRLSDGFLKKLTVRPFISFNSQLRVQFIKKALMPNWKIPYVELPLSNGRRIPLPLSAPTWSEAAGIDLLKHTEAIVHENEAHKTLVGIKHLAWRQANAFIEVDQFIERFGGLRWDYLSNEWKNANALGDFIPPNKKKEFPALFAPNDAQPVQEAVWSEAMTQLTIGTPPQHKFLSTTVQEFTPLTGFTVIDPD